MSDHTPDSDVDRLSTPRAAAALAAVADALIPAATDRPSASAAGVVELLQHRVPELLPARVPLLIRTVDMVENLGAVQALVQLKAEQPADFDALCESVAGCYFMVPQVRRLIGYPGQVRIPARRPPDEFAALVAPMLAAGFAPRLAAGDGPADDTRSGGH